MSNEYVGVEDASDEQVGLQIVWDLTGSVSWSSLAGYWSETDLPMEWLPEPMGERAALTWAVRQCHSARGSKRKLARPLASGGRALVDEDAHDEDLEHKVSLRAHLDEEGNPVIEPSDHPDAQRILDKFDEAVSMLTVPKFRSWITHTLLPKFGAVSMRRSGGVYFIPPRHKREWQVAEKAIRAASCHEINSHPMMRSANVVAWVLRSVERDVQRTIEDTTKALQKEPGSRGLFSCATGLADAEAKLSKYERLLGVASDSIREQLAHVNGLVVGAQLALEAQREG